MTRTMYDAISANASVLVPFKPTMVAIYLTGSPDIRWTQTQVDLFSTQVEFVRIDQGGATSPQYMADVVDVEPNAWSMTAAIEQFIPHCTAPRPTIYCDRNDYEEIPTSYTDDIWLAAPGLSDAECLALAAVDRRIVAVQNTDAGSYDKSIVIDPYWPERAPVGNTRVQVEYYKPGFGWVYPANGEVDVPESAQIRVRASNGTWTDWVEISPA